MYESEIRQLIREELQAHEARRRDAEIQAWLGVSEKERIVFLGTEGSLASIQCLAALLDSGYNVIAAISYRRKSLLRTIACDAVMRFKRIETMRQVARKYMIVHKRCQNINSAESIEYLKSLQPALICVCTFPQILKKEFFGIPPYGAINIHPSLLPAYKGANPYSAVLANKEKVTGVTVHRIDEGIDTGEIIAQAQYTIPAGIKEYELRNALAPIGASLAVEVVRGLLSRKEDSSSAGKERREMISLLEQKIVWQQPKVAEEVLV